MRRVIVLLVAVATALLGSALFSNAVAFAAAGSPDWQQSCWSRSCPSSGCWHCSGYGRASGSGASYSGASGSFTGGGRHMEADLLMDASDAAVAELQAALDELVRNNPEATLARDRAAAQIYGDHGFLFDQAELLVDVVTASQGNIDPADISIIQRNYDMLGLDEAAVEYGDWANQNLPAYQITLLGDTTLYLDPYANLRKEVFTNNAVIYEKMNDQINAESARLRVDQLSQQFDHSLLPDIVLLPGMP